MVMLRKHMPSNISPQIHQHRRAVSFQPPKEYSGEVYIRRRYGQPCKDAKYPVEYECIDDTGTLVLLGTEATDVKRCHSKVFDAMKSVGYSPWWAN